MSSDASTYHVFLSHNSQDKAEVEAIAAQLRAAHLQVFLDCWSLRPGMPWQTELARALSASKKVAVFIGPHDTGPWHHREMQLALEEKQDGQVIPVLLPGGDRTSAPEFLALLTWVDLSHSDPHELNRLVAAIKNEAPPTPRKATSEIWQAKEPLLWCVPDLPLHLLHRKSEVDSVVAAVLERSSNPVAITGAGKTGLHGMGGIGKSVIASCVARDVRLLKTFRDGVFWLSLGMFPDLTSLQSRLARSLGSELPLFDVEEWKNHLKELFKRKSCLLVLDDIWQAAHARAFDVVDKQSAILITTREGGLLSALGASECKVEVLPNDQALQLLAKWSEQPIAALPSDAQDVVSECGGLPLALVLCGAMARDGIPWGSISEALHEADLRFIENSHLDYTYPSVYRALKVSVDSFGRTHPAGPKRYLELAVFPKDETIPEAAVLTLWCRDDDLSERNARKLLTLMDRKALLRLEGSPGRKSVVLHDLQHDFIRSEYESE